MHKLFSTKMFNNNYMEDNRTDTSDDDSSKEINYSNDDSANDTDEAAVVYRGKRLTNQNGEGELVSTTQYNGGHLNMKNSTKQKIQRQPTRRPDPRVCNRNAIMARENRRRKKELIHQMENQISDVSKENKYLKKLVKQQGITISKLNNEKLYYKSIISNRTEIVKLLHVIGTSKIPITSSQMCDENKPMQINSNSLCTNYSDEYENGTIIDPLLSQIDTTFIDEKYFLFPDLGCDTPSSTLSEDYGESTSHCGLNGWDNLLNLNELMPIFNDDLELENKASFDIRSEHNYTHPENDIKPGVCLHVSSGRVSLEFCASCHNRANDACFSD